MRQQQPRNPGHNWIDDLAQGTFAALIGAVLLLVIFQPQDPSGTNAVVQEPITTATTHVCGERVCP